MADSDVRGTASDSVSLPATEQEVSSTRMRLLLVGTNQGRPFILEESIKTTRELNVELLLLDNPEARIFSRDVVPDANFIGAQIDSHDPDVVESIVEQVLQATGGQVDAVITFLNPYAELAGMLVDVLGAAGNSAAAVAAAHTKSTARELLLRIPSIATPYRVVASVDEAMKAYRELGGGKFVMKPIHGGGSALVITDIDSAEMAGAVYREIEAGLEEFALRPDAGVFMLDRNPGIMIERQLEGPEVDVELVLENGQVKFWHVSDNPPMDKPYAVEKGITFPSALPRAWQESLVESAGLAVAALGLKTGNMHVEMIATAEGPRILEVNARMGGAFVWRIIKDLTGINLVEQGLRSVLGLSVASGPEARTVIDARFLIPKATGKIETLECLDSIEKEPGIERVAVFKKVGDNVEVLPDDYFGWVSAAGRTYDEAASAMLAALDKVRITIRRSDGTLVEQTAAFAQPKLDMRTLLASGVRHGPPGYSRGEFESREVASADEAQ
ncbi:hypothetical protein WJ55_08225 [Burkholderia ubonensis]|nr:hypothetical protein WJ34_17940 [Burkholderia ubonensis]KVH23936.1 hypothetical protein WJ37_11010 [Burkholderia ubonensis]KVH45603.1 hypothetical protein WJ38_23315 [Burkholderia ubonensis]KVH81624.1 hypothetical protein WJ43_28300 [Burkholderia ubonensis]KVM38195.1 hypothetical protein WJ55_08225 [Burkholderia ubonensis]